MLISEKISQIIKSVLKENEQGFSDFLIREYGRQVMKSELAEAIVGWADLYMQGNNSGDFEGVAKYLSREMYTLVSDRLPPMFLNEITPYLKFLQNGEEENQEA